MRDYLFAERAKLAQQSLAHGLQTYQANTYDYVNAPPSLRLLVTQALQMSQTAYYNYGHQSQDSTANLWDALAELPVFRGSEQRLLSEPLMVLPSAATVELDAHYTEAGLNLGAQLVMADRVMSFKKPSSKFTTTIRCGYARAGNCFASRWSLTNSINCKSWQT